MQFRYLLAGIMILVCSVLMVRQHTFVDPETQAEFLADAYGQLPLRFEANRGQTDPAVRFLARGRGYSLFLTLADAVLVLSQPRPGGAEKSLSSGKAGKRAVLHMQLRGANVEPDIRGESLLTGDSNYFIGNDPATWIGNVPAYSKVLYSGVYPGIDLVYYGKGGQLEYDFRVSPQADPDDIRLAFEGATQMSISVNGDLLLEIQDGSGEVQLNKPFAYQLIDGTRRNVEAQYVLSGSGEVHFELGAYDSGQTLVIDPALSYSTYLGGTQGDLGFGIAVDASGNAYITGETESIDFPVVNPVQPQPVPGSFSDVFVAKLNAEGSALLYSTYMGGDEFSVETAYAIAVDDLGNAYVTGETNAHNFPTANAFQPAIGGAQDGFVFKLNPPGSALVYSTYLGGSGGEGVYGVAVDSSRNAYLTGYTTSNDFPVVNPIQPVKVQGNDAFVTKMNAEGSALIYSTYLGGGDHETAFRIAVDSFGSAFVTGSTESLNFPTVNAFQPAFAGGLADAFVSKLNSAGSALVYSTYLGGAGLDGAASLAVDGAGNVYVTGFTDSANFPVADAFQPAKAGGMDAYVTKLNAAGSALIYSTYLGGHIGDAYGAGHDAAQGIAVDSFGNAYVSGFTSSLNFPVSDPLQPTLRRRVAFRDAATADAFLAKFNAAGSALLYSTYFGGSGADQAIGVAVDALGNAYMTGNTFSTDFPTLGSVQAVKAGVSQEDAFVVKISSASGGPRPVLMSISPPSGARGTEVNITVSGANFVSGSTGAQINHSGITWNNINVTDPAQLTATLSITPSARLGPREVTVTTPGGVSNRLTFNVVSASENR